MDASRAALLEEIWRRVDPRLRADLERTFTVAQPALALAGRRVVLVGQRAAGKSWLREPLGRWLALPAHDLDQEIEARGGRRIAEWVATDERGFRQFERRTFAELPGSAVVAAGGGFLALHADLLETQVPVLVPITFETYRERLLQDRSRPRLRPNLSYDDELSTVYAEREAFHAKVSTLSLGTFLRATAGEQ